VILPYKRVGGLLLQKDSAICANSYPVQEKETRRKLEGRSGFHLDFFMHGDGGSTQLEVTRVTAVTAMQASVSKQSSAY